MGKFIDFLLAKPPKTYHASQHYDKENSFAINNEVLILDEIKQLKAMILKQEERTGYKGVDFVLQKLESLHISRQLVDDFVSKMKTKHTISLLHDKDYMRKELKIFFEKRLLEYNFKQSKSKQRKIVLIGPTGAGKTTAMFKIVSLFEERNKSISSNHTRIRVANFDNHKIGSKESFKKVTEWMEVEGESFIKLDDLLAYIQKVEGSEILLVDTTGKNPKNKREILEMTQVLESVTENAEVFLVVPSNVSELDLRYIFQEFNLLNYKGVILTKFDEVMYPTVSLGICMEFSVPVVFISEGKSYSGEFFMPTKQDLLQYFEEI